MKKLLIMVSIISMLVACSRQQQSEISTYKMESILLNKNSNIELLRVDDSFIYINELDTFNDPFLFTTKSLILLNHDGELVQQMKPAKDKRIVDFISYNGNIYYMYLLSGDNFFIEVCSVIGGVENIINTHVIDSPYNYPKFLLIDNKCFYKINEDLYSLEEKTTIFSESKAYFLQKKAYNNKIYYKTSLANDEYELYEFDGVDKKSMNIKGKIGNFIVKNEEVIFEDLENKTLVSYNLGTQEEIILFDDEDPFDYALLDKNIMCITTDLNIHIYDFELKEYIKTFHRKDMLENTYGWIFTDSSSNIYFQTSNSIVKINLDL